MVINTSPLSYNPTRREFGLGLVGLLAFPRKLLADNETVFYEKGVFMPNNPNVINIGDTSYLDLENPFNILDESKINRIMNDEDYVIPSFNKMTLVLQLKLCSDKSIVNNTKVKIIGRDVKRKKYINKVVYRGLRSNNKGKIVLRNIDPREEYEVIVKGKNGNNGWFKDISLLKPSDVRKKTIQTVYLVDRFWDYDDSRIKFPVDLFKPVCLRGGFTKRWFVNSDNMDLREREKRKSRTIDVLISNEFDNTAIGILIKAIEKDIPDMTLGRIEPNVRVVGNNKIPSEGWVDDTLVVLVHNESRGLGKHGERIDYKTGYIDAGFSSVFMPDIWTQGTKTFTLVAKQEFLQPFGYTRDSNNRISTFNDPIYQFDATTPRPTQNDLIMAKVLYNKPARTIVSKTSRYKE